MTGSLTEVTFPKGYVPLEVVQFLVLFVDSLATAIPAASIRGCSKFIPVEGNGKIRWTLCV